MNRGKLARLRLKILGCRLGIIVNTAIIKMCELALVIVSRKDDSHV